MLSSPPSHLKRLGKRFATAIAIMLLGLSAAHARINVVTLPDRDSVLLTIYNSVDLTMVTETRHLTFRQGINKLEFSWANTLIDPTSAELRAITHADAVEVIDVRFPPRAPNTLEWHVKSEFAGEVVVEIRYFTSGISWSADYVAEAARDEKSMALAGAVRVTNNSGEDYENARVRLVVGTVRLVEEIAQLARAKSKDDKSSMSKLMEQDGRLAGRMYAAAAVAGNAVEGLGREQAKEILKESVSEYFLYTVEGRDTLPNGWSKRMPSFRAADVPIASYYKFERERWGDAVMRFYRFTNAVAAQLGKEPLPDGAVQAFRVAGEDRSYAYVGRTAVKYIPIGEQVDLELGSDLEVQVKPTLMNWEKLDLRFDNDGNVRGWTTRETWQFEVRNSKDIDAVVDIRRNLPGDWSISTTTTYEKVDATKVKFVLPLKPREARVFTYDLTTRHGTAATR
jgi:hypothetical protein